METRNPLEVLFCDLCNASVPLSDVQSGTARQTAGKTVGACCLAALGARSPAQAVAPSTSTADPAQRPHGDSKAMSVGVVLLGAIAASTLFLDFRIGEAVEDSSLRMTRLAESVKSQSDVIQDTSLKLDSLASRADLDRIEGRFAAFFQGAEESSQKLAAIAMGLADARTAVDALRKSVERAGESRPDYGPALDDLRQQLQQQAAAIADLAAKPRAAAVDDAASSMPKESVPQPNPAADGLPPALAHQIGRLADADEGARFEAVDELLRSKDARVLPSLLPMAKDSDTFVRRLVVEGLRDFSSRETVDALVVALADPEQIVRSSAWISLKAMTNQDLPFDASASREARQKAQAKWQEWWEKSRSAFGG